MPTHFRSYAISSVTDFHASGTRSVEDTPEWYAFGGLYSHSLARVLGGGI